MNETNLHLKISISFDTKGEYISISGMYKISWFKSKNSS